MNTKFQLHHPICHLFRGERLYYILLNIKKRVYESKNEIKRRIDKYKLDQSTCAYFVFGDSDVIIRTWATENSLEKFIDSLTGIENYESHVTYLINRTSTWYERLIEHESAEQITTSEDDAQNIIFNGKPSDALTHQGTTTSDLNGTRFIMFIELPYLKTNDLFNDLVRKINDPENETYKSINKLSLYSYYTNEHRGVILKGEIIEDQGRTFSENSRDIIDISEDIKDYQATTITYICSQKLKNESDDFSTPLIPLSGEDRIKDSIYNLLISHDCRKKSISDNDEDGYISKHFQSMCYEFHHLFFSYNKFWRDNIRKVRDVFKWTIKRKDGPITSNLIKEYIKIESTLREVLSRSKFDLVQLKDESQRTKDAKKISGKYSVDEDFAREILEEISPINERSREETKKKITFGSIPHLLGVLKSELNITKNSDKDVMISKLNDLIEKCSKNRNDLMHGNVNKICVVHKERKDYVWKEFLPHYIEIVFLFPVYLEIITEIIEEDK